MRIAILSERWSATADEGMLNFLTHMARSLRKRHAVTVIYSRGDSSPEFGAQQITMGKGLISSELLSHLDEFAAEMTFYVPTACATLNALYRNRRLDRATPESETVLISLQRRDYGFLGRAILPMVRPKRMVVISNENRDYYKRLGFSVDSISVGVDLSRFCPVDPDVKRRIRGQYGLPPDRPVFLHVGHLGHRRGLHLLEDLAADGGFHVLFVASTATEADESFRNRMRNAGVDLRHEYLPNVQELYQASDGYVFPVENPHGSIEFPLSVLEAMACNLPVLTTRFGAIAECFQEGDGLTFIEESKDLADQARELVKAESQTRDAVESYGWDAVFDSLLKTLSAGIGS